MIEEDIAYDLEKPFKNWDSTEVIKNIHLQNMERVERDETLWRRVAMVNPPEPQWYRQWLHTIWVSLLFGFVYNKYIVYLMKKK
mmetsp:Transcript_13199/g.22385  ORF Transcript_13199/g.22385 Transcript_13199/m.22385 type:complete len:84 (+) Transcript_13199:262-513(+)|eukprot:CAMPEP_0168621508 /NCGR_PEP_ID=MMETSP0449_2-20121227/7732_1 /TAXON_ID=1082188 /ORGANISM="Strombidium rassoulzadegani, Strain ras09" /LENGTH=83 /DNA_ID=CAMNT_0008662633 /DNA_START=201 /DNA_END=452 /DNA_ORIENTATION=+